MRIKLTKKEKARNEEFREAGSFFKGIEVCETNMPPEEQEIFYEGFDKFVEFLRWSGIPRARTRHMFEFIELWRECRPKAN
jgi:hypothetical protein